MRKRIEHYWAIPIFQRLFIGTKWSVLGSALTRFLALVSSVVIARLLGVEHFGEFVIMQSTLGMFGVFAGLGLGVVTTKFVAELKMRDPARLGRILRMVQFFAVAGGGLIASILGLCANLIANEIMHTTQLANLITIASISIFFGTVDSYNNSALIGFEAVRQSVLGALIATLFSIPITIALTWIYGLQGAIVGVVLASIFQFIASHSILRQVKKKYGIKNGMFKLREWRILRDYALPALFSAAMIAPVHWFCQVLLINKTNGSSEMAVLGISFQWLQIVYFFPIALERVVLPIVSDVIAEERSQHFNVVLKTAILTNIVIALPLAMLIGLMSHWIMNMYGITNSNAWLVLSLMVTAAAISSACAPVGQVLIAKGKLWYGLIMNLGWALIYMGVTYLLLDFGALGIAIGLLAAYIIHSLWTVAWVLHDFKKSEV